MLDKKSRQFLAKPGRNLILFFRKVRMPNSWRANAGVAVETQCDREVNGHPSVKVLAALKR
jgi:hypothetical protein